MKDKNVLSLIKIINENPDLPVICISSYKMYEDFYMGDIISTIGKSEVRNVAIFEGSLFEENEFEELMNNYYFSCGINFISMDEDEVENYLKEKVSELYHKRIVVEIKVCEEEE